jgi:L-threonylcarbamoyladenylate synthase
MREKPDILRWEGAGSAPAVLPAAAGILQRGGVVLLPAEGLYGLHARALDARARARVRALKRAPAARGFILLVADPAAARGLARAMPGPAAHLAREAWPGALTLLLPAAPELPEELRPEGEVAVRCPGSALLRALCRMLDGPLLSTSANRSGRAAPAALTEIDAELLAGCDLAVDGGRLAGRGSTVARPLPDGRLVIVRPGLWAPPG